MSFKPRVGRLDHLKEDAAAYVYSPKGISDKKPRPSAAAAAPTPAPAGKPLRQARRRLSVVSDNKLVDGAGAEGKEEGVVLGRSRSVVTAYAGVSKKGFAPYNTRKKNQDSLIMEEHEETGALFLGALDGHGEAGDLVSQYFRARLPRRVFEHPAFLADPGKAMADALAQVEDEVIDGARHCNWRDASCRACAHRCAPCPALPCPALPLAGWLAGWLACARADPMIDTEFSGTTAVLTLIRGEDMWVANVGDSRVILASEAEAGGLRPEPVSTDHKPDLPEEKARILAAGGRVFAVEYDDGIDGPQRVWLGHMDIPGLAMSRSLGDSVAHTAGVSSEPQVLHRRLTSRDKMLILASDGLWEFVSNEEAVGMAAAREPAKAVAALVEESHARWMREEQVVDDTTIIVAHLDA